MTDMNEGLEQLNEAAKPVPEKGVIMGSLVIDATTGTIQGPVDQLPPELRAQLEKAAAAAHEQFQNEQRELVLADIEHFDADNTFEFDTAGADILRRMDAMRDAAADALKKGQAVQFYGAFIALDVAPDLLDGRVRYDQRLSTSVWPSFVRPISGDETKLMGAYAAGVIPDALVTQGRDILPLLQALREGTARELFGGDTQADKPERDDSDSRPG